MQYSIIAILNALMMLSVAQVLTIIVALPSSPANHFMPLAQEVLSSMTATYIARPVEHNILPRFQVR